MLKIEKELISLVTSSIKRIFPGITEKGLLDKVYLEIPKEERFGDFSVNFAMRLARDLKKPPMDIANKLAEDIKDIHKVSALGSAINDIRVAPPGFINFYLSNSAVINALQEILALGDRFGRLDFGKGKNAHIEFVSANPTGPLNIAHGRQAAIGDSLARILESCGYKVTREYYLNDEGVQMDILGKSVKARFMELVGKGAGFPEGGYKGTYIYEIAEEVAGKIKGKRNKDLSSKFFMEYAYKRIMEGIRKDLKDFGVRFDVWYSQKKLSKSGKIERSLELLKKKGFLYEKDGALWFRSTEFGDDKDRVVIKKDKTYTYLAPDIAYHREKFEKGYSRIINIWGPDHHGYVNRVKAACQALGFDKGALSILISQLVTLYRDKKVVPMSTREGEFITLRQVADEVGRDAARFFFMMRRTDSHLDFDLELAKAKSMDNPVYYIQYAHARIVNVIKFGGKRKIDFKKSSLLDKPEEIQLIKKLMQYPKIIASSARTLEPYRLLAYLQDFTSSFHSYYDSYRVVTDDRALTDARICLLKAMKTMFSCALALLGVNAPCKM